MNVVILLFFVAFAQFLKFNVLVGILHEDLGEALVTWSHVDSNLTTE